MKKLLIVFSLVLVCSSANAQEENLNEEVDYYPFDNWKPAQWDPVKQMKDAQKNITNFMNQIQNQKIELMAPEPLLPPKETDHNEQ